MKILLLTKTALKKETSTGNTTGYLFSWVKKEELFNAYFRTEMPNMDICSSFYCVPESDLIKHFFRKKNIGFSFSYESVPNKCIDETQETKMYNRFKKRRLFISLWARELLWSLTEKKWKKSLFNYIENVKPDCIYMPVYDCFYMHKILFAIAKRFRPRIILYSGDDFYTYNRYRLSPFYYINQLFLRKHILRSCKIADSVLCFSETETALFKRVFGEKVSQINKGYPLSKQASFSFCLPNKKKHFELTYIGNTTYGRIDTLLAIGEAIKNNSELSSRFHLTIYTQNQLQKKHLKTISENNNIYFGGSISRETVKLAIDKSDILLNVESFNKKEIARVRSSFSTKIVDYLFSSRCILSVGPIEDNSISYLVKRKACLYAHSISNVPFVLLSVIDDTDILEETAFNAFRVGKEEFDFDTCSTLIKKAIVGK